MPSYIVSELDIIPFFEGFCHQSFIKQCQKNSIVAAIFSYCHIVPFLFFIYLLFICEVWTQLVYKLLRCSVVNKSFRWTDRRMKVQADLYPLKSQYQPTRKAFVYKIQVNPIHTNLKYGNYYDFVDR